LVSGEIRRECSLVFIHIGRRGNIQRRVGKWARVKVQFNLRNDKGCGSS